MDNKYKLMHDMKTKIIAGPGPGYLNYKYIKPQLCI